MLSLSRCLVLIGVFIITSVMFSCRTTQLDRNWGRSYEAARYMQLLNPDAEKNLDPVLGLDGTAANHNVRKYRQSFKETEQKEIVNILKLQ